MIIITIGEAVIERIMELCAMNNITLNRLATISGLTQSTLNNITSRRNNTTTLSTVQKICDGLNITVKYFFDSDLFVNLEQEIK